MGSENGVRWERQKAGAGNVGRREQQIAGSVKGVRWEQQKAGAGNGGRRERI